MYSIGEKIMYGGTGVCIVEQITDVKLSGMDAETFCEQLLHRKKVAVVPGTAFGAAGEGCVRISYCYSLQHISEAMRRIREFLEELGVLPC